MSAGRPANIIPNRELHLVLPEDLLARLDLFLFDETLQRIPHGAYKAFISARIRDYFSDRPLDLAPFVGSTPGALVVKGPPEAIRTLIDTLKRTPTP